MMVTPILLILAIILLFYILGTYNSLIKLRNKVKQAKSGIDVFLKQRFDLIPNLVECVKGYSAYEKEVLEKVVEQRAKYNESQDLKEGQELNNKVNKLVALAEDYPELKASEQYLNLQKNLSKLESQLQAARRIYNNEVTAYNTAISVVPKNAIAGMCGFKSEALFEIEEYQRENVKIKIEG